MPGGSGAIERYYAALNAQDWPALLALLAPDAEREAPGFGVRRGHAEIEACYRQAAALYGERGCRYEPRRVARAEGRVTVDVHVDGIVASGATVAFEAVDVFDLASDGRIERVRTLYDSHAVREAAAAARKGEEADFEPLRRALNELPLSVALRFDVTRLAVGAAWVSMATPRELRHPNGAVPGVFVTALADAATSFALHTVVLPPERHVTTDLGVHFVRAAVDELLIAESTVVRRARRQAFARADIVDGAGNLCAVAMGTWAIMPDQEAAVVVADAAPDAASPAASA